MGTAPGAREGGEGATDITTLLAAAREGHREAFDRAFAVVYDELRRVASRQAMRLGAGTLATTALVHETYLKLAGDGLPNANDRAHFFALAARAMRQVLIDHARAGSRRKRGGGQPLVSLEDLGERFAAAAGSPQRIDEVLAVDRALRRLGTLDPELERLVEWRYFAGLTLEELADLTGTSERTLKRQWAAARAFLLREIGGDRPGSPT